ncbi:MAG: Alternative oxidase/tellurite resistance protein TehB [Parcubacteria bacterium C7867-006]|nr:MAG: Alternative oxidase/tellurite resistance protein TehB [Parcubacteria bacterium C7867-006]
MAQENVWEREYRKSKLLTKENKPQSDVVRFVQFLKKEEGLIPENLSILDLGSGTGRNSFYFAEIGNKVLGLEISKTAIEIGNDNAKNAGLNVKYIKQSIGEIFPCDSESVDVVLDVTSSNSLNESEREVFLSETNRVLKSGGYFFTKALCKDGDDNAKFLIKNFPGKEKDTYIMPELGVTERVWTKDDFVQTYEKYFKILHMEKKTSYSRMNSRSYKRNFWIVYMKKA